jgi:hypothetical protein
VACRSVSRHRFGKHVPAATDTYLTTEVLLEMGFQLDPRKGVIRTIEARRGKSVWRQGQILPPWPASRRRRRKRMYQVWDSKIWSRVPKKTALTMASSMYKRQTRPLVREGATQRQDRNCRTVINILSWAPDEARHQDLLTDWPSVAMWLGLGLGQRSQSEPRRHTIQLKSSLGRDTVEQHLRYWIV